MSQDDMKATVQSLQRRAADLERRVADLGKQLNSPAVRLTRFYPPLVVLLVALSFVPPFGAVHMPGDGAVHPVHYGNLWAMADWPGGALPLLVIALFVTLVFLLFLTTAFEADRPALPVGVAVLSGLIMLLLIARPGFDSRPDLTASGTCALLACLVTMVLAITQAVHLHRGD